MLNGAIRGQITDEAPNGVSDVFELRQVQGLVTALQELEPRFAEGA